MRRFLFLILILLIFGCGKDGKDRPDITPSPPEINETNKLNHYRDSIISLYGKEIKSPDKILSIYNVIDDTLGNHFFSGRTKTGFWVGAFDSNKSLRTEKYFKIPDSLNMTNKDSVFIITNIPSNDENAFFLEGFIVKKENMGIGSTGRNNSKRVLLYYNYNQNKLYNTYQFDHGELRNIWPWYDGSFVINNRAVLNPLAIDTTYILDKHLNTYLVYDPRRFDIPKDYDYAVSDSDYINIGWSIQSGIEISRHSIYYNELYFPKLKRIKRWVVNKAFQPNMASYLLYHEFTSVKLEDDLKKSTLSVTAKITGVNKECLDCEATSKFDTSYIYKININTGKEIK